jgi:lytic murein transglycosylase
MQPTRPNRQQRRDLIVLSAWALSACATAPPPRLPPAAVEPVQEADPNLRLFSWVATFRDRARAAGIDEATLHSAFDGVKYLPQVVERDRAQPEFTRAVWDYVDAVVNNQRVMQGQQKLAQVRTEAEAAAQRWGVPPVTLLAIWGIESNYGSHYGDIPTIDALTTLAFDGRREAWARGELLAALKILQNGDIERSRMIGSWAGAMGQTQFLPSAFLAHAVDGDADGRRDIWGSVADVLASTANFLSRSGWRAGEAWGGEVRLPPGFDLVRADGVLRQTTVQWAAEGVAPPDGQALPEMTEASLLLPAGARGPAFLTGANFRALLRYNNSINYALAVSLLGQRLAGGPGVLAAWPRDLVPLTRQQMRDLQAALNQRGFDSGAADGMLGPATRAGLRLYQRSVGLPADGFPTLELLQSLLADQSTRFD